MVTMPDCIAVIGATGHLGRALMPRCIATGQTVRMIARHPPPHSVAGAQFVACDATDDRALSRALEGCEIVANLSAGRPEKLECIAKNLKAALRRQQVLRLIQVSSLAIFGARSGVFDETSEPCPHSSHRYAISKVRIENLVQPLLEAGSCIILRPGCIYGNGAPIWTNSIARLLQRQRLGNLGPAGDGIAPLVHVDKVADALIAAIDAPCGRYHVLTSETITWNEYFSRLAHALGMSAPARLGKAGWAMEAWLRSPALMVYGRITGRRPDIISPAMRRLFATRARIVARFSLCPSAAIGRLLTDTDLHALSSGRSSAADRWRAVAKSVVDTI